MKTVINILAHCHGCGCTNAMSIVDGAVCVPVNTRPCLQHFLSTWRLHPQKQNIQNIPERPLHVVSGTDTVLLLKGCISVLLSSAFTVFRPIVLVLGQARSDQATFKVQCGRLAGLRGLWKAPCCSGGRPKMKRVESDMYASTCYVGLWNFSLVVSHNLTR